MNPYLAKEVRLLRPALVAALLLAVAPVWVTSWIFGGVNLNVCGFALCGGLLMLALSSFGREFELRTFSMQLAQPITRSRIFWTKSIVLALAMVVIYSANFVSWTIWRWWTSLVLGGMGVAARFPLTNAFDGPTGEDGSWLMSLGGLGSLVLVPLIAFAGGLWATLLLRQIAAAFWFAVLIPGLILIEILNYNGSGFVTCLALGLYSAAGYGWAWYQFRRAQEVAWTGGTISLSDWRLFRPGAESTVRARQPITALLRKEVQLYQVAILAMVGLFLVHLGAVWLRQRLKHTEGNAPLFLVLELFAGIWFAVPLLAGGLGVADERQLGTLDSQFCLPVSKRIQFFIKLVFALFVTGIMAAVLAWLAEAIGNSIGAGRRLGGMKIAFPGEGLPNLLSLFFATSLISFYASTLSRNILAIGVAVASAIVMGIIAFFWKIFPLLLPDLGLPAWGDLLIAVLGWPTVAATLVWLGYGNFRGRAGAGNLWFHNLCRLAAVVMGISVVAIAIYNRAWELVLPLEPNHGPARLAVGAPRLQTSWQHVSVLLPDGKLWVDSGFFDPDAKWRAADGGHFLDGTNWIAERKNYYEGAAIRADGTLWVSDRPVGPHGRPGAGGDHFARPDARLIQFGTETNWLNVAGFQGRPMILLKTDGTLWRWGDIDWEKGKAKGSHWPGLTFFQPVQLGTATNWAGMLATGFGTCVWDQDGKVWRITNPDDRFKKWQTRLDAEIALERWTAFDRTKWRSLSASALLGVREDGTLWGGSWMRTDQAVLSSSMYQIGADRDWVSAEFGRDGLMALKTDGSLWEWKMPPGMAFDSGLVPAGWSILAQPPKRLGNKSDWVAIGGRWGAVAALAADGGLWYWWSEAAARGDENTPAAEPLLIPSRKPVKVANIFGEP